MNHRNGYHFMDTDKATEMQEKINEQLKREGASIEAAKRLTAYSFYGLTRSGKTMEIKNVIFNYPATIVICEDGSKTVVKCSGDDEFDPEKGLAMAIAKRVYGDKGHYYKTFKKWLPEWFEDPDAEKKYSISEIADAFDYEEKKHKKD